MFLVFQMLQIVRVLAYAACMDEADVYRLIELFMRLMMNQIIILLMFAGIVCKRENSRVCQLLALLYYCTAVISQLHPQKYNGKWHSYDISAIKQNG